MNDVVFYVVTFLFRIISFLFVARFLLQACRVDFYNPLSQGFIKATDPVLQPLRKVLPGYRNLDIASLLAAILADVIMIFAIGALADQMLGTFLQILVSAIIAVALLIVRIFWWSILIVIVASFVAQGSYHPALNLLQQITEPILAPARRLLPAMGGLDFSPILVFLALGVVERILQQV
ncbi:MAG: YggT family protein [Gammaproteobacteria bacterium]|jgi:YggT family protein|nr:YggT family protein [Gammaproteobacteria bacterium]